MTIAQERLAARCTPAARARGDEMLATAPPARRFLLVEVPGPWHLPDPVGSAQLEGDVGDRLRDRTEASGVRLLLIRRPGRHPVDEDARRRWALATVPGPGPGGTGGLQWGTWRRDGDLLDVDLVAPLPPFDPDGSPDESGSPDPVGSGSQNPGEGPDHGGSPAPSGSHNRAGSSEPTRDSAPVRSRPLALICTHGRHDLCCAVEGRAVAAAADDPRVDVWECSHLGGDRFAANLLWLPSGLLLGGLTPQNVAQALDDGLSDRVRLPNYRGRSGDTTYAQAAQWFLMRELGEDRPGLVTVEDVVSIQPGPGPGSGPGPATGPGGARGRGTGQRGDGEERLVVTARHEGQRYRFGMTVTLGDAHHLTCRAVRDGRVRQYRLHTSPVRL